MQTLQNLEPTFLNELMMLNRDERLAQLIQFNHKTDTQQRLNVLILLAELEKLS